MKAKLLIASLIATLTIGAASAQDDAKPERKGPPAPADMAKRMIEKNDTDGDGKLDEAELTEAIKAMREHRGGAKRGPGAPGKGKKPAAAE